MDPSDLSFFTAGGDSIVPTDLARSAWKSNQMHGVAVSGALARAAEACLHTLGREDLRPARVTVDLFKPAAMEPCILAAEVTREGPRICLIDVVLIQGGRRVARSATLFLKPSVSAPGEVWSPDERFGPPPTDVVPPSDIPRVPFVYSSSGWSQDFSLHQNASRKQSWNTAVPVVAGEKATPFQAVAALADGASLVSNWGSGGVEYINTDITLTLAREPSGVEIGLAAEDRIEFDGIAVCTAAVFDRTGPLGNVVITSLANARRAVDLGAAEYSDDGSR